MREIPSAAMTMHSQDTRCGGRRRRLTFLLLAVPLGVLAAGSRGRAQEEPAGPVARTRTVLEQWVETRRLISQEKRDWAMGRELLVDRTELLRREIQSLRAKTRAIEESIAESEKGTADATKEKQQLDEACAGLEGVVAALESRTADLVRRLPEPIREQTRLLIQRLPKPGEAGQQQSGTRPTLGDRFMNLAGLLNEVNKFQREITVTSELRELPDGSSVQVTAMYLGIGQGYYVNAAGDVAGVGSATDAGWTWTPANEHAREIARAIGMVRNEGIADFVRLPVRFQSRKGD